MGAVFSLPLLPRSWICLGRAVPASLVPAGPCTVSQGAGGWGATAQGVLKMGILCTASGTAQWGEEDTACFENSAKHSWPEHTPRQLTQALPVTGDPPLYSITPTAPVPCVQQLPSKLNHQLGPRTTLLTGHFWLI